MHTDATLDLLRQTTVELGDCLREFKKKVCPRYKTEELPKEKDARKRRSQKASSKQPVPAGQGSSSAQAGPSTQATSSAQAVSFAGGEENNPTGKLAAKEKMFNLDTIKIYFLGDYVDAIKEVGTTDSYSTETVCHVSYT